MPEAIKILKLLSCSLEKNNISYMLTGSIETLDLKHVYEKVKANE